MPDGRSSVLAAGDSTPAGPPAPHRRAVLPWPASELRDAGMWLGLVTLGLAVTGLAVALHARLGTAAAPFIGRYGLRWGIATVAAPAVAVAVLVATRARVHERLPWRWLQLAGWGATAAWALALAAVEGRHGLAGPLQATNGYLADVHLVGDNPLHYLHTFVATSTQHTELARQHPPGPVLLLWVLTRAGLTNPVALGVLLTVVGCAATPLVAAAVRSLCHEPAARRLVPVLALAPWALWVAVSLDAVTMTVAAASVTCAVLASEARRSGWAAAGLAVASGLLLGAAGLLSYSAPWIAWGILAVYFVRRRARLNVVTGAALLVPVFLTWLSGFSWPQGLSAAQADFSLRIGPHRSWLVWGFLDLAVIVLACGPALIAAARKIRRTPGWPFLVGAVLGVGFAVLSGLSRGEVERSLLVFFPWLLVPAVAPEVKPDRPGTPASAPTPLLLVGLGAAAAVALEAVLRSPW